MTTVLDTATYITPTKIFGGVIDVTIIGKAQGYSSNTTIGIITSENKLYAWAGGEYNYGGTPEVDFIENPVELFPGKNIRYIAADRGSFENPNLFSYILFQIQTLILFLFSVHIVV